MNTDGHRADGEKLPAGLCEFVLNIVQYHDIVITVEPKRKALAEANEQLLSANARLTQVQAMVAELEANMPAANSVPPANQ